MSCLPCARAACGFRDDIDAGLCKCGRFVRAIFLPVEGAVRTVAICVEDGGCDDLQERVGGHFTIAAFGVQGVDCVLNEEAIPLDLPRNPHLGIEGFSEDYVRGNALLVRHDKNGDMISVTDEDVRYLGHR